MAEMIDLAELPHATKSMECESCGHEWAAVWPLIGADTCIALDCPQCQHKNWVAVPRPTLHLIISRMNGCTWIKPSRAAVKSEITALLLSALEMCKDAGDEIVLAPEDCQLRAFLTVDDSQEFDGGHG